MAPNFRARISPSPVYRARTFSGLICRARFSSGPHCRARTSSAASLQGAYPIYAYLQGADAGLSQLHGHPYSDPVFLRTHPAASLQGANLRGADLQGANLRGAHLQGADLRETHIWQTVFASADLSLADFRAALFDEPNDEDRAKILASFDEILDVDWRAKVVARVKKALTPRPPPWRGISGVVVDKFVLVDDLRDMRWRAIAQDKKTSGEAEYDRALAVYLAELARTDEFVASQSITPTVPRGGKSWHGYVETDAFPRMNKR